MTNPVHSPMVVIVAILLIALLTGATLAIGVWLAHNDGADDQEVTDGV